MSETWRPVKRYEGEYSISDSGRVRNETTGRILRPWPSGFKNRYLAVGLYSEYLGRKYRKNWKLHRLVADAFLPRGDGVIWLRRREVNHKDLNPHNNALYNLEWMTREENEDHKRFNYFMAPPAVDFEEASG